MSTSTWNDDPFGGTSPSKSSEKYKKKLPQGATRDLPSRQELVEIWVDAYDQERYYKAVKQQAAKDLRAVLELDETKEETAKFETDAGMMTVRTVVNRVVDKELLADLERHHPELAKKAISYNPRINNAGYKALDDHDRRRVDLIVTAKAGMPSVSVKDNNND